MLPDNGERQWRAIGDGARSLCAPRESCTVGLLHPADPVVEELAEMISDCLARHGIRCRRIGAGPDESPTVDLVLAFGFLPGIRGVDRLLRRLRAKRVPVILWEIETLPPVPLDVGSAATTRQLNYVLARRGPFRIGLARSPVVGALTARLQRQTSELSWFRSQPAEAPALRLMYRMAQWIADAWRDGLFSDVLVSLRSRLPILASAGVPARVVPVGYHPSFGRLASPVERDIDATYVGGVSRARIAMLDDLQARLRRAGRTLQVVTGSCYGDERTRLLNRTRILLNVLNHRWEFPGMRMLMGMGCGCLVVSQQAPDTHPYRPGEHFVVAEPARLADTLLHYLAADDERLRIARQGHRFVTEELRMEDTLVPEIAGSLAGRPATPVRGRQGRLP